MKTVGLTLVAFVIVGAFILVFKISHSVQAALDRQNPSVEWVAGSVRMATGEE